MRRISFLLFILFSCFVLSAQPQVQAQWRMGDPGQLGHYAVGHTSYLLTDTNNGNRPVYFMVWYPADPAAVTYSTPPAQYPLDPYTGATYVPITLSSDWEAFGFDPAYEGLPISQSKPFPLVVFSPGSGLDGWQFLYIGTRLASHGYVVAIPEPWADGQWPWNPYDDRMTTVLNRPRDLSFIITELLEKNRTRGELLFRSIDPERIAASGHSLGGYAAYALAGGDNLVCDSLYLVLAGLETLPYPSNTCVPARTDDRIKAIVALDGASSYLHYKELARISVPSLIVGETVDQTEQLFAVFGLPDPTQFRSFNARPHAAIDRHDSYRVDVNGASHMSFAILCDALTLLENYGVLSPADVQYFENNWPCYTTGLNPMLLSPAETHQVATKYMIAFLDLNFHNRGSDPWLDRWILTPEYALTHTPTVQFFNSEDCQAALPDHTYFRYRAYQTSSECDIQQKNPTGWFASQSSLSDSSLTLRTPAIGLQNLRPPTPFHRPLRP
jgi:predicted dienelactone hydrolase